MELAPVTLRANLFKARASVRRQVFSLSPALAERFARVSDPAQLVSATQPVSARGASMTYDIEERLLTASAAEIRELQLDPLMREAAELCVQSQVALASALAAECPRTLTTVVLARHRRRWKWRLLVCGIFVPLAVLVLILSGTAIAALVTAFLWP